MKVTLITPHIGRKDISDLGRYVQTWLMEPLPMAALAGLTPKDVELTLFDERVEFIDFDQPTDLVAIAVETYTAKRSYEIAAEYHRRGVPTVMGGYHVTLCPDEVARYSNSIVVGYAEHVWEQVIRDAQAGQLQPRYSADPQLPVRFVMPDRSIFGSRHYLPLSCVETGRGCPLHCDFCCIQEVTNSKYYPRPVAEIVEDIRRAGRRTIFFIDDNIVGNVDWAKSLFRALIPLKISWFSQGTLSIARDKELLALMRDSGCVGLLIGFESFKADTLRLMKKEVNLPLLPQLKQAVHLIHSYGICIYGAFVFGYDSENTADFQHVVDTAKELGLFMAAFNHLVPFPGTPFYRTLETQGRVQREWWLSPDFRFGEAPFTPLQMTRDELHQACLKARKSFYSWPSIARRAGNWRGNLNTPLKVLGYGSINSMLRKEIKEKDGLPLGNQRQRPEEIKHGLEVRL